MNEIKDKEPNNTHHFSFVVPFNYYLSIY